MKRISINNSWYFEKCWLLIKISEKRILISIHWKDHSEGCRLLMDSYYLRFLTSPLINSFFEVGNSLMKCLISIFLTIWSTPLSFSDKNTLPLQLYMAIAFKFNDFCYFTFFYNNNKNNRKKNSWHFKTSFSKRRHTTKCSSALLNFSVPS